MSCSTSSTPDSAPASHLTFEKLNKVGSQVSPFRLAGLTISILGVQMFWSIIMAHGNPYLSSMGFSPALSSLVWIAGPLAGAFVQPIVGMWSDACSPKSSYVVMRFGRRKPFIVFGAFSTAIAFLVFANVRECLESLGLLMGISWSQINDALGPKGDGSWILKMAAILWVYVLNLTVQPLQVGVRTYIVDSVPSSQQVSASAWVSRWNSLGAVVAFWLGSLDLPSRFSWLGSSQLGILVAIDVLVLLITIPFSFWMFSYHEPVQLLPTDAEMLNTEGIFQIWRGLYHALKVMPHVSWTVCQVQFWSWMAWFPFLYYNTTYVAKLGASPNIKDASSFLQPVVKAKDAGLIPDQRLLQEPDNAAMVGSFASFLFALTSLVFTLILPCVSNQVSYLTVPRLWVGSQVSFAVLTIATLFVHDVSGGLLFVACLGYSWAMTQWAPYALISKEISRLETESREIWGDDIGEGRPKHVWGAGAILGLHNVAIAGPQIIAAVECSVLFGIFRALNIADEVGWLIRITGLPMWGAALASRGLIRNRPFT